MLEAVAAANGRAATGGAAGGKDATQTELQNGLECARLAGRQHGAWRGWSAPRRLTSPVHARRVRDGGEQTSG